MKRPKRNYSFGTLRVGWNDGPSSLPGHFAWLLEVYVGNKIQVYPNSPETCIGYGDTPPGTNDEREGPAKPMRYDTPYVAHMEIFTDDKSTGTYTGKYRSWFCLSRDAANKPIILKASWNRATEKYDCVPPEKADK